MTISSSVSQDNRAQIIAALDHMDHVLPGQGPIHDFVHHNTIHGFQHLPFEEALAAYEDLTGTFGYLPEAQNREFYQRGRINDRDLFAALAHDPALQAEQSVYTSDGMTIKRKDLYRIALLFDLQAITVSQLNWQIEEMNALGRVQADVPEAVSCRLLADSTDQASSIRQLWERILGKLGLEEAALHPENMLDLSVEQAEDWLEKIYHSHSQGNGRPVHQKMRQEAEAALDELMDQVGVSMTLRDLILALSGIDILFSVRPLIIRICASAMDEGMAAWQLPDRKQLGLYAAWRATAQYDANAFLHDLPDWQRIVAESPEDPVDAIIMQLTHLEIPPEKWEGYLCRLALELPGWSGLINWREHHQQYHTENDAAPKLADYLAIRMILNRLWLDQACRETWNIEARLGSLQHYFRKNLSEFMVRRQLYRGILPEYLTHLAKALILRVGSERHQQSDWQQLADLMWTWQLSPMAEPKSGHSAFSSGWRLFRSCQHLGLSAEHVDRMPQKDLLQILTTLDEFNVRKRGEVWLYAFEHNYREDVFQALRANRNRGRWAKRDRRPEAQVVFCIDEREESIRRHLEEINPAIETLGAAGFFGVPMNYRGLDDTHTTALCPVGVMPVNGVDEIPREGSEEVLRAHNRGRNFYKWLAYLLNQSLRSRLLLSHAAIDALAPFTLAGLLGKTFLPTYLNAANKSLRQNIVRNVPTQLQFVSTTATPATQENPQSGFTDREQADRIAGFLRNAGLTYGFAPIICFMAHGSTSQNNPHEAAHDCGACSGRRGGPNARVFAAMANRPEVRALLAQRDIVIPDDCRLVGAEHDTCSDVITWYDVEDIPSDLRPAFDNLKARILQARAASAQERCRRFFSAHHPASPAAAMRHVTNRSNDLSQVRPEYGHATNASAVIGRRSVTQGIFLDRRAFLISYDATQDPEGKLLENLLLTVGPVGAGISLEYYFSTINNERFGCGTKVPHNIIGLFGVMEGASSDLRTGLPKQMVEVHEAMRLQIIVEAKISVLGEIYGRQESLRELIGGGWVLLSAIDPVTAEISIFERGVGFVPWQSELKELPLREKSVDCYRDLSVPVSPILIKQPEEFGA
ncbi:MAG: DUF2309 domain-containing protein [Nitrosospira sp.]|nr:DUF2309 domain-containing protein [Nitrosospira sp.]